MTTLEVSFCAVSASHPLLVTVGALLALTVLPTVPVAFLELSYTKLVAVPASLYFSAM